MVKKILKDARPQAVPDHNDEIEKPSEIESIPFDRHDLRELKKIYRFLNGFSGLLHNICEQAAGAHVDVCGLESVVNPGFTQCEMFYKKLRDRFEKDGAQ